MSIPLMPIDFTTPAIVIANLFRGKKLLAVHLPGWTGGMLVRYLKSQGVKVGKYGMEMDGDEDGEGGEIVVTVDDYRKATEALRRLHR